MSPLPFLYESTGDETTFTDGFDPEPRSRPVVTFHRPETLARWLRQWADDAEGGSLRARLDRLGPVPPDGLRRIQVEAIKHIEDSMLHNHPRALAQMATGSGKTFMAANLAYRLVQCAGAERVLFLVDRANLGRQTLREFQQFATPGDGGSGFTSRAPIGYTAIASRPVATNQGFKSLVPSRALASDFLYWQIQHLTERIRGMGSGTTFAEVSKKVMATVPLVVPPLAEQQRIVAAIEEAFSKLDAGEAGLRTVRQLLKRMRDAVLAAAVTGRLVPQDPTDTPATKLLADLGVEAAEPNGVPDLPPSWAWTELGVIAEVVGGVTKDAKRQSDASFVEVPYLRVANVQRGFLDLETITTIRVAPEKAAQLELQRGDVLFNEGGDRDKLGRVWVWEGQIAGCIHQNHVFRARLSGGVEPKLVSIWGNTFGRGWFETRGKQTTNLASLNLKTLKGFPVPIAPVEEQSRILAEVERQMSFLEVCEREVDLGLARSAELRRSVLKAAFEGRLVPQDPSDEPASALLDRIRGSRVAPGPRIARRDRRHTPSVKSEA